MRALAAPVADGRIAKRSGWYASPGHVPRLTPEQRAFFDELVPAQAGDLVPVDFGPAEQAVRRSKIAGVQAAFDARLGTGELVRVGEHLYGGSQIAEIRHRLEGTLVSEGTSRPPGFGIWSEARANMPSRSWSISIASA